MSNKAPFSGLIRLVVPLNLDQSFAMSAATNSVANPTPLPSPLVFSPDHHKHLIPLLLPVHVGCITQDHTLAFFLPPLSSTRLLSYWQSQTAKVAEGSQAIIVQQATNEAGEEELAGVVVLSYANPVAETGPFRGEVEKLLVSPRYRRRGVARRLMAKLEEVAKEEGRTLLVR